MTFGGGLTMIAFMQEQLVSQFHWLTPQEFIDGLALGQFTPGPILMVAAYVGYKIAGVTGAVVGGAAAFLPSFVMMLAILPTFDRVRRLVWTRAALRGIAPAVIGVLAVSLVRLAPYALPDVFAIATLLATVVVLLVWRFRNGDRRAVYWLPPLFVAWANLHPTSLCRRPPGKRSLIAAEYFNRLAAARGLAARATSAGTEPDDAVPPRVTQGLRTDGIDVEGHRPRRPTPADVEGAAAVVTFGCDLGELASRARQIVRWDDVPAVSEDFKRARDVIVARVTGLLEDPALGR